MGISTTPLTDKLIKGIPFTKAKPRPNKKPIYSFDDRWDGGKGSVTGLYIRVGKQSKVFYYRYTNTLTKKKFNLKIGDFSDTGMNTVLARAKAKKELAKVIDGHSPQQDRMAKIEAGTFEEYSATYCKQLIKAKSRDYEIGVHQRYLRPRLGKKLIWEITNLDLTKFRNDYEDKIHTANRIKVYSNKFFSWAVEHGYITGNPASGIKGYQEESKEVRWTEDEVNSVRKALTTLGKDEKNNVNTIYISLLFLTGRRQMELCAMEWNQIDFKNKLMLKVNTKTGLKDFELDTPVLVILKALKKITFNPGGNYPKQWLFPSTTIPNQHRGYFKNFWEKIRAESGITQSMHDIRHYFARTLLDLGYDANTVGRLLGHKDGSMVIRVYGDSTGVGRIKALQSARSKLLLS